MFQGSALSFLFVEVWMRSSFLGFFLVVTSSCGVGVLTVTSWVREFSVQNIELHISARATLPNRALMAGGTAAAGELRGAILPLSLKRKGTSPACYCLLPT